MFNKTNIAVFVLSIVVGLAAVALTSTLSSALNTKAISTGSYDSGDVIVELTPVSYKNGELTFQIAMDTHSVSLGQFDLAEITVLEYKGKTYKPSRVRGGGGHHASVKIVFKLDEDPENFSVIITGIPMVEKRVFKWN